LESLRLDEEKERHLQREKEEEIVKNISKKKRIAATETQLPPLDQREGVCSIGIRLPNGDRLERRFYFSTKLQRVVDFVEESSSLEAGRFQLVSSFPRRVFVDGEMSASLEELGLSSKVVLLAEYVA